MAKKEKSRMKTVSFEIVGLNAETRKRWRELGNIIKRVTNCFRRVWLSEHTKAGSIPKIHKYLSDLQVWYATPPKTRGLKPKCPVECFTSAIDTAITKAIKHTYDGANIRCVELVKHKERKRMTESSASKSSLSRWLRILSDDGEFPCSSSPQPIPFDKKNGTIVVPLTDKEDYRLVLHVDRIAREKKNATSNKDQVTLLTRKKGARQYRQILDKIVIGEFQYAGSSLVFSETKGKWFARISYKLPANQSPQLNTENVAFLYAGKKHPWLLRIDGYNHWMSRSLGHHVARVRRQLCTHRWSYQSSYRCTSSARKGHGYDRAYGRLNRLRDAWTNFVNNANNQITIDVVRKCAEMGYGRIVFFQPTGSNSETRLLFAAGKTPGRRDGTGWDWFQVAKMLKDKAAEFGIKVDTKKIGERESKTKKAKDTQAA